MSFLSIFKKPSKQEVGVSSVKEATKTKLPQKTSDTWNFLSDKEIDELPRIERIFLGALRNLQGIEWSSSFYKPPDKIFYKSTISSKHLYYSTSMQIRTEEDSPAGVFLKDSSKMLLHRCIDWLADENLIRLLAPGPNYQSSKTDLSKDKSLWVVRKRGEKKNDFLQRSKGIFEQYSLAAQDKQLWSEVTLNGILNSERCFRNKDSEESLQKQLQVLWDVFKTRFSFSEILIALEQQGEIIRQIHANQVISIWFKGSYSDFHAKGKEQTTLQDYALPKIKEEEEEQLEVDVQMVVHGRIVANADWVALQKEEQSRSLELNRLMFLQETEPTQARFAEIYDKGRLHARILGELRFVEKTIRDEVEPEIRNLMANQKVMRF